MQRYVRTGAVEAGKIIGFNYRGCIARTDPATAEVTETHEYFATLEGAGGEETVEVDAETASRLQTQAGNATPVGGYLVRYGDGWLGWSPAHVFERDYAPEAPPKRERSVPPWPAV